MMANNVRRVLRERSSVFLSHCSVNIPLNPVGSGNGSPFTRQVYQNRVGVIHGSSWTSCYLGRIVGGRGDSNIEKFCDRKDGDFRPLLVGVEAGSNTLSSQFTIRFCSSYHWFRAASTTIQKYTLKTVIIVKCNYC